jgi:tRNA A37 threonylcarbamoyladenosine dehydratase
VIEHETHEREGKVNTKISDRADRRQYPWRPLVISTAEAHQSGGVVYDSAGVVTLRHVKLGAPVEVPPERQYPCVLPTLMALDKALSHASNSPRLRAGLSLRQAFDAEYQSYLERVSTLPPDGPWEPDYGSYVFDRRSGELYLVAPPFWHRIALLASNGKLNTDPAAAMTAEQIRDRLAGTVVGFVGASLGSNVVESVMREMRPLAAKIADPDYLEATNLNRLQHGSLRYLTAARAKRTDPRSAFETHFVNKVHLLAYENQLVDPYLELHLYDEGLTPENIERFLLGGDGEPRLDYVVEEADDLRIKVEVRKRARAHGIPVIMASDVGNRAQVQLQDYATSPEASLGFRVTDAELHASIERCMSRGTRDDRLELYTAMLGAGFAGDDFMPWLRQEGEQPTSSIPQSGAIALLGGALAGKLIALHRLGHPLCERLILDTRRLELFVH